jgi:zinc transport system ATP-binding protein
MNKKIDDTDNQSNVIFFDNVTFAYEHNLPILTNVNISIPVGESSCIVGPNGGGKSTLLKLITGQLKPQQGTIEVLGLSPDSAKQKIGYMPQHTFFDRMFPVNVLEVVLMGRVERHLLGRYSKLDKELALRALADVDMEGACRQSFSRLSGGQQQRVLIARALVCEPEILLLDEPTASVDPAVEEQLTGLLCKLRKKLTILTVTHDLGFVSNVFSHVICVNKRVVIHPTSSISGDLIQDIYGRPLSMVHHNHKCEHYQ